MVLSSLNKHYVAAILQLLLLLLLQFATFHSLLLFRPSRGSCTLLYCSPCQNIHCCSYGEVLFLTSLSADYLRNKCHICLHEMGFGAGGKNVWLCTFFFFFGKISKKKRRKCLAVRFSHLYFIHLCELSDAIKHFKKLLMCGFSGGRSLL